MTRFERVGWLVGLCCSDGASRSGVYIALDVNLRLMETEGQVDIYGYVRQLRQMRPYMVENKVLSSSCSDCLVSLSNAADTSVSL